MKVKLECVISNPELIPTLFALILKYGLYLLFFILGLIVIPDLIKYFTNNLFES